MDAIKSVILNIHSQRYEEDVVDRWNYQLTAYMFAFCTLIITSNTYMGKPIICWTPAEFRDGWTEYARDYCLIENTYFIPVDDPTMPNHYVREEEELPYYQWVQFVLVILAFFFFVPHLIWRSINWWSGIQVRAIVTACCKLPQDEQERSKKLDTIVGHVYRTTYENRRTMEGFWVSGSYLVMKFLYIINIVAQMIILHIFLGFNWNDLFSLDINFQTDWRNTGLFPRSTMCDFEIRNKGNLQRYSVQCVLSQNMFNEKIFLVLFYWLFALFVMTVVNTGIWVRQILDPANRRDFAVRLLSSTDADERAEYHELKKQIESNGNEKASLLQSPYNDFVSLPADLLVLLRLISSNAGDNVTSQVLSRLYALRCEKMK